MKFFYYLIVSCCCVAQSSAQMTQSIDIEWIDSIVALHVKPDQPGVAIGIIMDSEVALTKYYGMANLEYRIPVSANTRFNLASCSKQFTAACCLLLEREGKLNLDGDIRHLLPAVSHLPQQITVRNLIHHTSGVPTTDLLQLFSGDLFNVVWDQEDEMQLISGYPKLNFTPNAEHMYSNSGYFLIAKTIEAITEMPFEDYLRRSVFKPLGMIHSDVYDKPGEIIESRAVGYAWRNNQVVAANFYLNSVVGSTNLYSTIEDMLLWDMSLLKQSLLGESSTHRMFYPRDTLNNGDTIDYTYGQRTGMYKNVHMISHSGYTSGFSARNLIIPERNFAVAVFSNSESVNTTEIAGRITDKLLKLEDTPKKERKERSIHPQLLASYEGVYQLPDGMRFQTQLTRDTLWLLIPGAPKFRLVPESDTDFFLNEFDAQCTFAEPEAGGANKMIWHQNGGDHPGIRVKEEQELTREEAKEYAGEYQNRILGMTYPVKIAEGKVVLVLPSTFPEHAGIMKELPLIFLQKDRFFATNLGPILFKRNDREELTGFVFEDVGRGRNIELEKTR